MKSALKKTHMLTLKAIWKFFPQCNATPSFSHLSNMSQTGDCWFTLGESAFQKNLIFENSKAAAYNDETSKCREGPEFLSV